MNYKSSHPFYDREAECDLAGFPEANKEQKEERGREGKTVKDDENEKFEQISKDISFTFARMKLSFCDAKRIFEILITRILLLWNRQLTDKMIKKD